MNVLVTGGSGFIGTRLVSLLIEAGHDVSIFDKNPSQHFADRVILADVRDVEVLTKAVTGSDVVYHLAAEHHDNVRPISLYDDVNVGGAKNLVKAMESVGVEKLIFTSSVAIYPLNAGEPTEDSTIAPFNPYGQSKYEAEKIFRDWAEKSDDRSLTIIRPAVVFGEDNRGNVYNLLKQIHSGRFRMIGRGQNKKSMGYVGNITQFMLDCLKLDSGVHIFNYADKPDLKTNELIHIVKEAFGKNGQSSFVIPYPIGMLAGYSFDLLSLITRKKFSISSIRIKKFCADTTVSADRVIAFGFKAPYTFEEALKRTIKSEFPIN
ncbi:MAG: NAD-dependent epimerase/dehydratase family protein, partial [Anaerohalosphaera sp.]|nr:NAD-dependent epimerase/dehydratase family protein [Anaerohalosphaera sp.]